MPRSGRADGLGLTLVAIPGLATLVVLGWHAVVWLKTGLWPPLSLADALVSLGAREPVTSWQGLQAILEWLPLWLALLVLGGLAGRLASSR